MLILRFLVISYNISQILAEFKVKLNFAECLLNFDQMFSGFFQNAALKVRGLPEVFPRSSRGPPEVFLDVIQFFFQANALHCAAF